MLYKKKNIVHISKILLYERNIFIYFISFILLVFMVRSTIGNSTELISSDPKYCCYQTKGKNRIESNCMLYNDNTKFKCIGYIGPPLLTTFDILKDVKELNFSRWQSQTFDPLRVMTYFPNAQRLDIYFGNLSDIVSTFPDSPHLQIINISFTNLQNININLFKFLPSLKVLDLRYNKLKYIRPSLVLPNGIQQIFLYANAWNCSHTLRWWFNSKNIDIVVDRSLLLCSDPKYQGRNLMSVAYYKKVSKMECQSHLDLRNCTCTVHYITKSDDGKSFTPLYAVNCSNLNFQKFPSYLPDNTTIFYANDNQIFDIKPLRDNERYKNVIDVYLDNNNIKSVDVLEAGYWLRHFRVLSLKRNQLRTLPLYAIDNALENNFNAVKLQLSQNPWVCDCKFTMRFREILMKYDTIIQDSWNVTCSFLNEGEEIVQAKVLSIERFDVCKISSENNTLPLDLLNGTLAVLIFVLLAKLGYDYYRYKNYGNLPWIATKLP